MQTLLIEAVGWIGALLILAGYALLTSGRVTAQSPLYQWLNVVGAAGFIVNGLANKAYPSAGLNIVWMGIGGVALWKIASKRRTARHDPGDAADPASRPPSMLNSDPVT